MKKAYLIKELIDDRIEPYLNYSHKSAKLYRLDPPYIEEIGSNPRTVNLLLISSIIAKVFCFDEDDGLRYSNFNETYGFKWELGQNDLAEGDVLELDCYFRPMVSDREFLSEIGYEIIDMNEQEE